MERQYPKTLVISERCVSMLSEPAQTRATRIGYELDVDLPEDEYEIFYQNFPSSPIEIDEYNIYQSARYLDPEIFIEVKDIQNGIVRVDGEEIGTFDVEEGMSVKVREILDVAIQTVVDNREGEYDSDIYWIIEERCVGRFVGTIDSDGSCEYELERRYAPVYEGISVYQLLEDGMFTDKDMYILTNDADPIMNHYEQNYISKEQSNSS